jgi:hypothetical protein
MKPVYRVTYISDNIYEIVSINGSAKLPDGSYDLTRCDQSGGTSGQTPFYGVQIVAVDASKNLYKVADSFNGPDSTYLVEANS